MDLDRPSASSSVPTPPERWGVSGGGGGANGNGNGMTNKSRSGVAPSQGVERDRERERGGTGVGTGIAAHHASAIATAGLSASASGAHRDHYSPRSSANMSGSANTKGPSPYSRHGLSTGAGAGAGTSSSPTSSINPVLGALASTSASARPGEPSRHRPISPHAVTGANTSTSMGTPSARQSGSGSGSGWAPMSLDDPRRAFPDGKDSALSIGVYGNGGMRGLGNSGSSHYSPRSAQPSTHPAPSPSARLQNPTPSSKASSALDFLLFGAGLHTAPIPRPARSTTPPQPPHPQLLEMIKGKRSIYKDFDYRPSTNDALRYGAAGSAKPAASPYGSGPRPNAGMSTPRSAQLTPTDRYAPESRPDRIGGDDPRRGSASNVTPSAQRGLGTSPERENRDRQRVSERTARTSLGGSTPGQPQSLSHSHSHSQSQTQAQSKAQAQAQVQAQTQFQSIPRSQPSTNTTIRLTTPATPVAASHAAEASTSSTSRPPHVSAEADALRREADEGLELRHSRASLRSSARTGIAGASANNTAGVGATSGASASTGSKANANATANGAAAASVSSEGGSNDGPPSMITGVSASGKGVKVGASVKIGTGPGGVQRKKGRKGQEDIPNQDFCSACRGIGRFLCCDGCPRSFHFMCLEPPLRVDELPEEETWYCKKCAGERAETIRPPSPSTNDFVAMRSATKPSLRPIAQTFKLLCRRMDEDNPAAFRLPPDVVSYFAGVTDDGRGNYVDGEEARVKIDRKGFQEDRDAFRLADKRSKPIICYVCKGTSAPLHGVITDPGVTWRPIVSCDHCTLHWHLDCLTPPLTSLPPSGRKWMCPNHVEQVMPRKRTIRKDMDIVEISKRNARNNGNVEVVSDEEEEEGSSAAGGVEYADMMINRRKYKVPEHIIKLDFWDKLKGKKSAPLKRKRKHRSGSESSLTSLGTQDGTTTLADPSQTQEDLDAAALILSFSEVKPRTPIRAATPTAARISEMKAGDGLGVSTPSGTRSRSRGGTPSRRTPGAGAGANHDSGPASASKKMPGTPNSMQEDGVPKSIKLIFRQSASTGAGAGTGTGLHNKAGSPAPAASTAEGSGSGSGSKAHYHPPPNANGESPSSQRRDRQVNGDVEMDEA